MPDKQILEIYYIGFSEGLWNKSKKIFKDSFLQKAYNLGRLHASAGDDCKAIDGMTEEQVLKEIKQ